MITCQKENGYANLWKRIFLFSSLYFIQGMLNGFATIALAAHLIERGVVDSKVAGLVAIFFLPWTFKVIWAVPIDLLTRRDQAWAIRLINLAQVGCTIGLCALSFISDPANSFLSLSILIFVICVFVSLQDVAADALVIRMVASKELPFFNSGMRFGRYLGVGVGALISSVGLESFGFSLTTLGLAGMAFCVTALSFQMFRNNRFLGDNSSVLVTKKLNVSSLISATNRFVKSRSLVMLLLFGFFVSLSESMVKFSIKPVYVNELNWSAVEFSAYRSFGSFLTAIGAAFTAILIFGKIRAERLVTIGSLSAATVTILFAMFASPQSKLPLIYLIGSPVLASIAWVGFVSLVMQKSKTGFSATKFATVMTVCNMGTVSGVLLVGPLQEHLLPNYIEIILVSGFLTVFMSILLLLMFQQNDDD